MTGWRVQSQWDRPIKHLASSSTHYLLLQLEQEDDAQLELQAAQDISAAADALVKDAASPRIAIALDCSRSMSEHQRFAACVVAVTTLVEALPTGCEFQLAVFSKSVSPLTSWRNCGGQAAQGLSSSLGQLRQRSVSRLDLALAWLGEQLASSGSGQAPRLAILLSDWLATDEMGYEAGAALLGEHLHNLRQLGVNFWAASVGEDAADQARLVSLLGDSHGKVLCGESGSDLARKLLAAFAAHYVVQAAKCSTLRSTNPESSARNPVRLLLESRQHGLLVLRACRLHPAAANLELKTAMHGWELDAGQVESWQKLQFLLELRLPSGAFGAPEGLNKVLSAVVLDKEGCRQAELVTSLDYTGDIRKAQQLNAEVDKARRIWDLAGIEAWTAQSADGASRVTGVLPPAPGFATAPPVGGVPQ